uniref:DUF1513 domain-containing protein n=1 Tax=uncultured Roseovarius sp. TaxID=293344 RepID=UPI00260454D5
LPERGHAAAAHPDRAEAVAFARRPGRIAFVLDCTSGAVLARLDAPLGRHFYGHGTFVGGDILCTTENEIDTGAGRIGLWSRSRGYTRVGEIASNGIGPHDIRTLADGETLAVANGGIRTHPDHGREKLNLDTMRPNLSYLSTDGTVLEEMSLAADLHQNSIRHLALGPDDTLAFALQWQGDTMAPVPLLGLHRRGQPPRLSEAPLAEQLAMQGYAGSVAWGGQGPAITSPRGGRAHIFDESLNFRAAILRADICGLAPMGSALLASDGQGGLIRISGDQTEPLTTSEGLAWDNHIVLL